jgi:hypothetical protein
MRARFRALRLTDADLEQCPWRTATEAYRPGEP